MSAAELVERGEEFHGTHGLAVNGYRHSLLKAEIDVMRFVGGHFRGDGEIEHLLLRLGPGVFEDIAFVAHVPDVAVAAVGRLGSGEGDVVFLGVGQGVLPRTDVPFAPGGDDAEQRVQRLDSELETHLVVAFASAAVGHSASPFLLGNLDHVLGGDGARKGGAEQVLALVDGAGLHRGKGVLCEEFFAQVDDVGSAGPTGEGLFLQPDEFFIALPDVGREGDDFTIIVLLEPGHDDRRVEAARVGQHNLVDFHFSFTPFLGRIACPAENEGAMDASLRA